jgi:hypothetical protein
MFTGSSTALSKFSSHTLKILTVPRPGDLFFCPLFGWLEGKGHRWGGNTVSEKCSSCGWRPKLPKTAKEIGREVAQNQPHSTDRLLGVNPKQSGHSRASACPWIPGLLSWGHKLLLPVILMIRSWIVYIQFGIASFLLRTGTNSGLPRAIFGPKFPRQPTPPSHHHNTSTHIEGLVLRVCEGVGEFWRWPLKPYEWKWVCGACEVTLMRGCLRVFLV